MQTTKAVREMAAYFINRLGFNYERKITVLSLLKFNGISHHSSDCENEREGSTASSASEDIVQILKTQSLDEVLYLMMTSTLSSMWQDILADLWPIGSCVNLVTFSSRQTIPSSWIWKFHLSFKMMNIVGQ